MEVRGTIVMSHYDAIANAADIVRLGRGESKWGRFDCALLETVFGPDGTGQQGQRLLNT